MTDFRVQQIDHVEFFVPNRREAAAWYARVLGFEIVKECEFWAESPSGPLMISSDGGNTKLALFRGEPQGERPTAGFRRVAFRVDGASFLAFLQRLADFGLEGTNGKRLAPGDAVDHDRAWSIYFRDPYGHPLEVTTYDYEEVSAAVRG